MANLTYAQLEGEWIAAGGSSSLAPLMAAIAEAESGGNPLALNPNDNGGKQSSYGLWQISTGTHTPPSPNWNNPLVNAQLAVAKYNSQGLGAWGTYTTGAYKAFLSNSTTPDTSGLSSNATLTAATSGAAAGATSGAGTNTGNDGTCAWSIGFGGIPGTSWLQDIFGGGGNIGSGEVCIISKSQIRGVIGVGVMGAGLVILAGGVSLLLTAAGLGSRAAQILLRVVPGGAAVAGAASAAAPGDTAPAAASSDVALAA